MEYQYRDQYSSSNGGGFMAAMGAMGSMIFGAFIGAAIALLMAPKPGSELRHDLREGASRMGERISDTSHEVVESMRDKVSQIGREAEQMGEKAGQKAEAMGDKAQRSAEDISKRGV